MVEILDPQDDLTNDLILESEEDGEPTPRKYSLEWANEWLDDLNKTNQQQKNDNTLAAFLVFIVICIILVVWIFGRSLSSDSNETTIKANEPSSSQNEDATTKPNTPSSESSKPATSVPETPTKTETAPVQTPSNSSSSTPSYGNVCIHYEHGRCWDDLEDEAYDAGRWDGSYGYYGDSYYEGDNCDDLCQSIMEDAYDEGYYDY